MSVKKCPKCGSVWYSELPKCAFCGVEGELQNMPILTGKVHGERAAEKPQPAPVVEAPPVAVAEATPVPPTRSDTPPPAPPPAPEAETKPEPMPEGELESRPRELPPPPPPPRPRAVEPPPPGKQPWWESPSSPEAGTQKPEPEPKLPPAPKLPSAKVPLVFACLGFVAVLVIPAAIYWHADRVGGILTLLGYGVLAPFAPFAWLTGRRYEERSRALGFEPSAAGRVGRVVGTMATFVVVVQASLVAVLMAVLHLAGQLPNLFSR